MFEFKDQTAKFEQLVQALIPDGYGTALYDREATRCAGIADADDHPILQVFLYDVAGNLRGADLHFIYDLRTAEGVEVHPVVLAGDALDALNRIQYAFKQ
jgi:hypothetical protein